MSNTKIKETKSQKEHPLEDFFDIERGSTEIVEVERETDLVHSDDYDDKDNEIEENFQEIYDRAMEGYDVLADEIEDCDPRYKARVGEVSLQHLNVALNAAGKKASMKQHKDKIKATEKIGAAGGKIINNTMIVDRNDLLDQILERKAQKAEVTTIENDMIDGDVIEETTDE